MKGIILAGGSGTRLYPLTLVTSKQLLPVYDKPMIYYPLSTLMLAASATSWSSPRRRTSPNFERLLGGRLALRREPLLRRAALAGRLAQAFTIGEEFIAGERARWCSATTSSTATAFRAT